MDDRYKYQTSALKWLYEMELLDDPQLINNLKLNIFEASDFKVKDADFIMSQSQQKMLIWIEVGIFSRKLFIKKIYNQIYDRLRQLLPNYEFRIVTDRSILELAISKLKNSLVGGTYAVSTNNSVSNDAGNSTSKKPELPKASDLLPDQEKLRKGQVEDKPSESVSDVKPNTPSNNKA